MAFPDEVRTKVLLWCDRHCCLCKKPCGVNIEVHHIIPSGENGGDDIENAIPLCFDCHSWVQHYNREHPRGTKYKVEELRRRRDQIYDEFTLPLLPPIHYELRQDARRLPDIGFVVANLGDRHSVQLKVRIDILQNLKYRATAPGPHYDGTGIWNLNAHTQVNGHFLLPFQADEAKPALELVVNVTAIDIYGRPHRNFPVSWVYIPEANGWYFEPIPSVVEKVHD